MILGGTVVSSVEFSGKISLAIFFAKCLLRCSYCHNSDILEDGYEISKEEVFKIIDENSGFIDAVVVSGGEPLIQLDALIEILKYSQKKGLKTKLDTSGCYPKRLEKVIDLLDYISIDVKAPFDKYSSILLNKNEIDKINISKNSEENNLDIDTNKVKTKTSQMNTSITTINTIIDNIDAIESKDYKNYKDYKYNNDSTINIKIPPTQSNINQENENYSSNDFIDDEEIPNIGEKVKESIEVANNKENLVLECRTTYVPSLLSHRDIIKIAKDIKCDVYTIQQFRNKNVLSPNLESIENPNPNELKEIAKKIKKYQENIRIKSAEFGVENLS